MDHGTPPPSLPPYNPNYWQSTSLRLCSSLTNTAKGVGRKRTATTRARFLPSKTTQLGLQIPEAFGEERDTLLETDRYRLMEEGDPGGYHGSHISGEEGTKFFDACG